MSGETAARARSWCARRDEKNRRKDSVRSWMDGPVLQAERELVYRPEVSIDEAIRRALEWFRAQGMVPLDGKLAKAIQEDAEARAVILASHMNDDMNVAFLSAVSALTGSVVGGLTSAITSWLSVRSQDRAGRLAREMSRRDELYKDFIVAASKTYGDALMSNEPHLQELVILYAMISRMRVLSSPQTIASAQMIVEATIDTYFAPNKTIRELHELIQSGTGIDPLKNFSEAAREELRALTSF